MNLLLHTALQRKNLKLFDALFADLALVLFFVVFLRFKFPAFAYSPRRFTLLITKGIQIKILQLVDR